MASLFLQRVDKISLQLILKRNGASIGKDCDIETGLILHNCKDYSNLIIGNNCHIGKNCFFDLRDELKIGNNVVVSMKCSFITHIDMAKTELRSNYPSSSAKILIEHDSYIGANCTILMNMIIGNHSFIAAGSLVNRHVNPYTLVGGVPAVLIKYIS